MRRGVCLVHGVCVLCVVCFELCGVVCVCLWCIVFVCVVLGVCVCVLCVVCSELCGVMCVCVVYVCVCVCVYSVW